MHERGGKSFEPEGRLDRGLVSVVVVAAGQGTRLGAEKPKAFIEIGGKPLLIFCLDVFDSHPAVLDITLICAAEMIGLAAEIIAKQEYGHKIKIVEGGGERFQSVQNGLAASSDQADWVMVHDAARPFVTNEVISSVLGSSLEFKAVVTATPEVDTVRRFEGDYSLGTVDRNSLARVGTPQLFHKETLRKAFSEVADQENAPTDEAYLMEQMGMIVGIAWGDPRNFKITTQGDLEMAKALVQMRSNLQPE